MTSREKWVMNTRNSVIRALVKEQVPMSAGALEHNLDIDRWTDIGPHARTSREISAALRWAAKEGLADEVTERTVFDPPGKLYEARWPIAQRYAALHPRPEGIV